MTQALFVTGAAGQPGRRVIDYPLQRDTLLIIATTRHSSKLAELAAKGVGVRAANFDKPETVSSTFAGVDRALYVPGQRVAEHQAAIVYRSTDLRYARARDARPFLEDD